MMNSINKKTILLVEDEAVSSIVTSKTLHKFGYDVLTVNTGDKAVEIALKNKKINLILMDIDLGSGIDGIEAAEKILHSSDIPVVFLSIHTEPEIVEKIEKITSYGYVVKNSNNTVLDASIKMAFKLFDAHKKAEYEITERKLMGQALHESEQMYRFIVENVNESVWLMDMTLKVIWISPSVIRTLGYTLEELQQMPLEKQMAPESLQKVMKLYAEYFTPDRLSDKNDNIEIKGDFEYYKKDGSLLLKQTEFLLQRNIDGEPSGLLCIGNDITDRKHAENMLKENEQKYQQLFNHAPTGLYEVDFTKGRFVRVNSVMSSYTGYTESELLSMNPVDILTDDSRKKYITRLENIRSGKEVVKNPEFCLKEKNGHTRWVELYTEFLRKDGQITGAAVVAHDITSRKQTENLMLKYSKTLHAINEFSLELSYVPYEEIYMHIVNKIKKIFSVKAVWITMFDEKTSDMIFEFSSLSVEENSAINKILGKKLIGYRIHLDEMQYMRITSEQIISSTSLKEVTVGGIPEIISKAIKKLFGYDWFISVALMNKDKLAGSIAIAGHSRQEAPRREEMLAFANITANALERRKAEYERETALNELRKNEEQMRIIANNLPAFVNYVNSGDLTFLFVNQIYADAFGTSPEMIKGRRVKDIIGKESYERELPYIKRAQSGERVSFENTISIHGESRLFNVNFIPEFDLMGQVHKFIVLAYDITDQKQIELTLKESEEKFRSYIENAPEGIFVINSKGFFQDVNNTGCNIIGYTRDEFLKMNILQILSGTDLNEFKKTSLNALKTGGRLSIENIFLRNDGSKITARIDIVEIREDQFLGFVKDITETKQIEVLIKAERDLGVALAGTASLEEACSYCLDAAMSVAEMDSGGVYFIEESGGKILIAHKGLSNDFIKDASYYSADSPNARIVQRCIPVFIDSKDIKSENKKILTDILPINFAVKEGLKSIAIVPVVMMGKAIACINISSHIWETIPLHARMSLERIASRMGMAINRIKSENNLRSFEKKK